MSDFDTELRDRLATLAERQRTVDLYDAVRLIGKRQRYRRRLAATGATAVAASIAILVPLAITTSGTSSRHLRPTLPPRAGQPTVSSLQVTAPVGPHPSAIGDNLPPCRGGDVAGTAQLESTVNGVVGVVKLVGDDCSLRGSSSPAIRVPPSGAPALEGESQSRNRINAIGDPTAAWFALGAGRAAIGFQWLGSWCEPAPPSLIVTTGGPTIRVPLSGSPPPCRGGTHYSIVPGNVAPIGQPALAAPLSWSKLTTTMTIAGPNNAATLIGIEVNFDNPTGSAITLDPNPNYVISDFDRRGDGTNVEVQRPLPYPPAELTVPAHGSLSLTLPNVDISADAANFVEGPVTVTFSIAGVPTATVQTHVPR